MLTASEDYRRALRQSHRALTRCTVLAPVTGGGFTEAHELSVVDGSLQIDGTRNIWRSGSVSLVPQESVDRQVLLDIDSTSRLRLDRGIQYPDGSIEWVTIGLLQVQTPEATLIGAQVNIAVSDLGSLVEDFKLPTAYVPQDINNQRLTTIQAIQDLVTTAVAWDVIPGWDIDPTLDVAAYPALGTVFTGSRWTAIQSLSESLGAVTYVQPSGRWAIRSTTVDLDSPVDLLETGAGGVVTDIAIRRDRADQYNAIPLRWESPNEGGLVFIVDADPASPTFWDGPFGRKPRDEETNDLITSEAQAISAATALLDQYRGLAQSLTVSAVHNPLLEPLDVVRVRTRTAEQTHVIDSITYPLAAGTMSVRTRLLRVEV
ncbi:MAG: hypothetical protein RLZ55_147 [Actinomycetota bacterium]